MLQNGVGCRTSRRKRPVAVSTPVSLPAAMALGLAMGTSVAVQKSASFLQQVRNADFAIGTLAVSPLGDLHLGRKLAHERRLGAADPLGNRGDARRQLRFGYAGLDRRLARQGIARQGASDDCDQGSNRGSVARVRFT